MSNGYAFSYDDIDEMISSAAMPGGVTVGDLDLSGYLSDSGPSFDFGSLDTSGFSFDNIDSMINDAALGLGDFDFNSLDLPKDFLSSASLEDIKGADLDALLDSMGRQGLEGLEDVDLGDARVLADMATSSDSDLDRLIAKVSQDSDGTEEIPFGESAPQYRQPSAAEREAERERYERYLAGKDAGLELGAGQGVQDFGSSVDMAKSARDFDENLTDIIQNRGGFTSGFQKVGSDRIMVRDDGTGIGVRENGEPFSLSVNDVNNLIKTGKLNTFESGYNVATGGNKTAPGGGSSVVLNNGSTGQLLTNGRVIDTNTGKVIGTTKDVKNVITQDGEGKKIVTQPPTRPTTPKLPTKPEGKNNNMILALLALLALMNKGGGGSSGPGAVIPSLQANRRQLPYGAAAGSTARPGAGGVTYFSPTTYTTRAAGGGMMYGGGGISSLGSYSDGGRLLRGPGDGVSDSIPATIGGKQPARLATGEFVVPARIVSELGNGSTEAGAKKLYAMMDRVQKKRRKTKNVAADTKADKYLPA